MARYEVTTPVAGFTGEIGGVQFVNGRAVIDEQANAATLAYCAAAGYGVVPADGDADEATDEVPKPARRTRSSKETNA
jgi:hypothetical protein